MSYRAGGGICCMEMTCSKNYINKDGQHPEPGMAMDGFVIVLSKEELADGKWLFYNVDPEVMDRAKMQTETLQFFNNWIAIIT